jgi:hypothetical protein
MVIDDIVNILVGGTLPLKGYVASRCSAMGQILPKLVRV